VSRTPGSADSAAGGAVYRVPERAAAAELREKGSRFLASVAPAGSVADAKRIVAETAARHRDATHVVFAWRIGWPPAERASDAGEPSGTSGPPVLRALASAGLSDAVATVVRWYGGVNLGKGGLVRAYGDATRAALAALPTREERRRVLLTLATSHERQGAVRRLLRPGRIELVAERYGAGVELDLRVAESDLAALEEALGELGIAAQVAAAPATSER
jgi:uncharacterized YigZ family protein